LGTAAFLLADKDITRPIKIPDKKIKVTREEKTSNKNKWNADG